MSSDLSALQQANPVHADALEPVVALEGDSLLSMLEERATVHRLHPARGRVRYALVVSAAAGLAIATFFGVRALSQPTQTDLVTPAADAPDPGPTTPGPSPIEEQTPTSTGDDSSEADGQPVDTDGTEVDTDGTEVDTDPSTDADTSPAPSTDPDTDPSTDADTAPAPSTDPDPVPTDQPIPTDDDGALEDARPSAGPARPAGPEASFIAAIDLLVVHHDMADGLDDGQATVATRELATWAGITPLVVAGTTSSSSAPYNDAANTVLAATWGTAWLNADADRAGAVAASAGRWVAAIDAGGHVWVAEGGPSLFTAEVLDEVRQRRPGLDTTEVVHVVQHNVRSEGRTPEQALAALAASADYRRIDDGNVSNTTADLRSSDDGFSRVALTGAHGEAWAAAFDYLAPEVIIDFSDAVAVLEILGVSTDAVGDVDDFAERIIR